MLYFNDLFLTGVDEFIVDAKRKLTTEFEMKDLGMMHYFLGMEVWHNVDGIFLIQGKYTVEILKRFRMLDCAGLQGNSHTHGIELEATLRCFIRVN